MITFGSQAPDGLAVSCGQRLQSKQRIREEIQELRSVTGVFRHKCQRLLEPGQHALAAPSWFEDSIAA